MVCLCNFIINHQRPYLFRLLTLACMPVLMPSSELATAPERIVHVAFAFVHVLKLIACTCPSADPSAASMPTASAGANACSNGCAQRQSTLHENPNSKPWRNHKRWMCPTAQKKKQNMIVLCTTCKRIQFQTRSFFLTWSSDWKGELGWD